MDLAVISVPHLHISLRQPGKAIPFLARLMGIYHALPPLP